MNFNWFEKNFWGAEISVGAAWAALEYLEGTLQLITAIAATIAAIFFVIRGYYEMRTKRFEYQDAKEAHKQLNK
jgi:hypothetical protein